MHPPSSHITCCRFLVERGVRLRANDITYTLTAVPEGGCDTPSIRSKALAMIYALNLGVRLNRKHWNTAVGCAPLHTTSLCAAKFLG